MPFEDEDLGWTGLDPALSALSERVIGALIEVHRRLGAGLEEGMYEEAVCMELELRGMAFVRQRVVRVEYKGRFIGEKRLDLIVEGKILVELKAVEALAKVHFAQVRTYLLIAGLELGLLVNFNVPVLKDGIKRVVETRRGWREE